MTKVLLVEDDNNLREIYEARLAAEGYDISTAKDGEDALAVAKQQTPDLIISDVMMPRISGFEMLDILRNTDGLKHTKVIMLTALGQAEDKSRADNLGADRYLVKSQVTLEDIVKAADELLNPTAETAPGTEVTPAVPNVAATPPPEPDPVSNPVAEPVMPQDTPAAPPIAGPTPAVATEPEVSTIPEPAIAPATEPAAAQTASEPPVTTVPAPDPVAEPTQPADPGVAAPAAPAPEPTEPTVATPTAPIDDTPVTPITITTPDDTTDEPVAEPAVAEAPTETPEPEPAIQMPQPPTDPEVAAVTATVQSALEESNDVEQQIKDFEATTPIAVPEQSPETLPAETNPEVAATTTAIQPTEPIATPPETPEAATDASPQTPPSVAQIPGKLVIQPPTDHAGEPDISALVAQEEYQEQTNAGITGQPVVSAAPDQPATVEAPANPTPQPGGVFMPNNGDNANDTAL